MAEARASQRAGRLTAAFLRIGVSAAILAVIFAFVPAGELLGRMRLVSPALWISVLFGFLVGHAVAAAKWRAMIGGSISYRRALQAHFAGLAANIALPGAAGGDLVRAGLAMKGSGRKTALALGSLADRLIDTAALLVVAAVGAFWLGARAGVSPLAIGTGAVVAVGGGIAAVIFLRPISRFLRMRSAGGRIGRIVSDAAAALEELAARRRAVAACAVVSIGIQFAFASMNAAIAQDLGLESSWSAWVFAWPLAKLVAMLPISFGGIGVREASLAGIMAPLGYDAAGVVAASLVWQTVLIAAGLTGALAQAFGKSGRTAAEARGG
jgi:uncharacterized membrane protein YbhN (UPF0104 family)